MPTYIVRRPMHMRLKGKELVLSPGDELPEWALDTIDAEASAQEGVFVKIDGNQARSLRAAREKREKAKREYEESEDAYAAKMRDLMDQGAIA